MYLLPLGGQLLWGDQIVSTYNVYPLTRTAVMEIVATYGLFLFLISYGAHMPLLPLRGAIDLLRPILVQLGRLYCRVRLAVGVAGVSLGVLVLSSGLSSYIFMETELSQRDPGSTMLLMAGSVWRQGVLVDLIYSMFVSSVRARNHSRRWSCENILLSVGLLTLANGIGSLFVALMALLHGLFPSAFQRLMFVDGCRSGWKRIIGALAWLPPFVMVFLLSWYWGSILKVSSYKDVEPLLDADPIEVLGVVHDAPSGWGPLFYLLERLSIYYHSWTFTSATPWEELNSGRPSVLEIPINNGLFRLDFLLGGINGLERPELASIAQLNYRLLTAGEIRPREGSAPGLFGSFNYVFPMPLNIVFCAFFLRWVCRLCETLFYQHNRKRLSWLGIVMMFWLMHPVFQSPFDWLLVFDDAVIFMTLLLGVVIAHRVPRQVRVMEYRLAYTGCERGSYS